MSSVRESLPLSAFAFAIIVFGLPLKHVKGSIKSKLLKVDYLGCFLVLASSILMLLGLTWAGATYPWGSAHVLAPLLVGLAIGVGFCLWEWKGAKLPIMPIRLFGTKNLACAYFITATNGMVYYFQLFYLPQYFQTLRGASPILSGVLMLPLVVSMIFVSMASGYIVSKTSRFREVITCGWVLWTASFGLIATFDENTSVGKICGSLLFTGIGAGQTFQTTLVAIQASAKKRDMAVATSIRNFIRTLGGTLSLAIAQTIIYSTLRSDLRALPADTLQMVLNDPTSINANASLYTSAQIVAIKAAYQKGFHILWYVCAALACCSTFVAAFLLKNVSLKMEDEEQQKAKSKAWLEARKARHSKSQKGNSGSPDEEKP